MTKPVCPTCKRESMIGIHELTRGCEVMHCIHCDLSKDEHGTYVYQNHCWNTSCNHAPIDSGVCKKSVRPGMGYHCPICGKDLTEWKIKIGLLQAA